MLAETAADSPGCGAKVAMERRAASKATLIGANELRSLAPYLGAAFLGAGFAPGEGHIDPLRGTMALRRLARARRAPGCARGWRCRRSPRDGAASRSTTGAGRSAPGAW